MRNFILTISAVLAFSTACFAGQVDPDTLAKLKERFAAADKNGDGKLTRDECAAGMPRIYKGYDQIDADKKGYITLDQIITFVGNH